MRRLVRGRLLLIWVALGLCLVGGRGTGRIEEVVPRTELVEGGGIDRLRRRCSVPVNEGTAAVEADRNGASLLCREDSAFKARLIAGSLLLICERRARRHDVVA